MAQEAVYTADQLKDKCVSELGNLLLSLGFKVGQVRHYQGALAKKIQKCMDRAVRESKALSSI